MGEIDELPECIFAKKKDTATFQVEIAPNGENIDVCVAFMECVTASALHALYYLAHLQT